MPSTTISDVARAAQVGVGTVSRVLNNHPAVHPDTRSRVLAVIEALGYQPNPHARRIAGGRSYTVSIMLPMVEAEFYTRLLTAMEETLSAQRYDSALFPLLGRARLERYLSSNRLAYQADGVIMVTYDLASLFEGGRLPTECPVVLVDGYSDRYDCAYVDNYLGGLLAGRAAAKYPGELYVLSLEDDPEGLFVNRIFQDRMRGLGDGLAEAGKRITANYLCALHYRGGQQAAERLFREAGRPCTVFAAADLLAVPVLEEAERQGWRVGRDIRVIGFDDQPWASAQGLTTVHQPVELLGQTAAQLLLERLDGLVGPARSVRFEPELVERRSTLG